MGKTRATAKVEAARLCAGALVWLLVFVACSSYVNRSAEIKSALLQEDYEKALATVEGIDQSSSQLLYLYEKGLILHYQDRFAESSAALEAAELLLEELYTKSITREIAALAIADNIAKYRGDAFEAVLVNYYKILNYLHLGDLEGALVECRRVNQKLQVISDSGESYFENDPFLQYLTAMVYEAAGEHSEAGVSYRVAVQSYQDLGKDYTVSPPNLLYCDAASNARRLGDFAAAATFDSAAVCPESGDRGSGRVNVFLECGYVAHKIEANAIVPIFKDDDWDDHDDFAVELSHRYGQPYKKRELDYVLKFSLPQLQSLPVPYSHAVVRARRKAAAEDDGDIWQVGTDTVENLNALAAHAFAEKQGKVLIRAIARALVKYAATQGAESKDAAVGALVNLLGVVTESADTRSWTTLPGTILMARLELPPGTYDLDVNLRDGAGATLGNFVIPDVNIVKGRTRFINYRVY